MTIAAHVQALLNQIETVRPMSKDERSRKGEELHRHCRAIQRHVQIIDPLYHGSEDAVTIEKYFGSIKPTDILDDDVLSE
jgi:hypothetical protein